MNSIEFETRLLEQRYRLYRHPKVDILGEGFRPMGGSCGDMGVAVHEGRVHFFYIERRLTGGTPFYPGHEVFFGHASTANFFDWEVHDPVLLVRPGTWEEAHVWAPVLMPWRDGFLMAYTGVNYALSQDIGLAFSRDMFQWERLDSNPLSPAKDRPWSFWRTDAIASCRDPHLLMHEGRLYMTYTANTRQGESCVAMCSTSDFDNLRCWEDHGPILVGPREGFADDVPGQPRPQNQMESSNLMWRGGRWRLCVQTNLAGYPPIRNWVFESDRMDHFDLSSGREFWKGAYTVEVVKERGTRALLAATGWIRFGEVDWADPNPTARFLTTRQELEAWWD